MPIPQYQYISDLPHCEVRSHFMTVAVLADCKIQSTRGTTEMLRLDFSDRTGRFSTVLFSNHRQYSALRATEVGVACVVHGVIANFEGRFSPEITAVDVINPADTEAFSDRLVASSPVPFGELQQALTAAIASISDLRIRLAVDAMIAAVRPRFDVCPAAARVHHAYRHGLLTHTVSLTKAVDALLPLYAHLGLRRDLVMAAVIVHDSSKVFEYTSGLAVKVSPQGMLSSHVCDVHHRWLLAAAAAGVDPVSTQEVAHILLSHHGEKEYGSPVTPHTPEAWFVHKVDDFDACMGKIEGVITEEPTAPVTTRRHYLDELVRPSALMAS